PLITLIVLRRIVIRPLQHAAKRIEKIASGDLTMNDEPAGSNEIGRLSRHLQQMQHSLGLTVGNVRKDAEKIYRGPSE
ncbi:HAMP domain-containing protein, partial [Escherichia coli]|uniref:HAMP domain-containing protein n=1 Tax=Escherichia coli TaxID=562 RepID=UPI0025421C34